MKKLLAFSTLLVILCFSAPAAVHAMITQPYTASADYIMFDIDRKVMYCEGQTELLYGMLRVQAEKIRIDVKSHILHAEGNVTIETMAPRTLKESPESSREAGVSGADAAVSAAAGANASADSNQQLEKMTESVKQGHVQTFEGDVLYFDLDKLGGVLVKTKTEVRKIYLQGEALDLVSQLPSMGDESFLYEEPQIIANAWTAKRIRVSADAKYEAWSAQMWVKGNKVFPTLVPYYTNNARGLTPGNLRIKRVRYSSNTDWNLGAGYRYSEKKGREGNVDIGYAADGNQLYTANLNQQFRLSKSVAGSLGLGNILTSRQAYGVSLSHYGADTRMQSLNANLGQGGKRFLSVNDNRRLGGLQMQSLFSSSREGSFDDAYSSVRALIRLSGRTKHLGKTKKYGMKMDSSLDWDNTRYKDSGGSAFVGVSLFRSAIRLSRRSSLNTSMNFGLGRDTDGFDNNSFGTSIGYSRNVGKQKSVGLSYKFSRNRSVHDKNIGQYVSMSFSQSRLKQWNARFSTSYDLRRGAIGTISPGVNYDFNKKCSFMSDWIYDVKETRFNMKNYNLKYDFYGSVMNTRWFVESNDFVMDLTTKF